MSFSPSRLLLLLVFGGLVLPLYAQQTVVISDPTDAKADRANSFLGDPKHQINAGDYNAPRELFNNFGPTLPMPKPVIINQDPSVQDALNKRRNWTLLTPEQILGIKTPEEILGVNNQNSDEKKLSLEEQFLLRQSRATAFAATNGRADAISWRDNNPFDKIKDDENPFARRDNAPADQKSPSGAAKTLSQLFNARNADSFSGNDDKSESAWTSVFAQPSQPKPTLEQIADLERFRAMMEPNSAPDKLQIPTRFSTAITPAPDPYLQPQPKFNPAGRSYSSLENEAARPTGINPLPGITGPAPKPVAKKPSWEAQLPPWLTDGPQPHNANRNF